MLERGQLVIVESPEILDRTGVVVEGAETFVGTVVNPNARCMVALGLMGVEVLNLSTGIVYHLNEKEVRVPASNDQLVLEFYEKCVAGIAAIEIFKAMEHAGDGGREVAKQFAITEMVESGSLMDDAVEAIIRTL